MGLSDNNNNNNNNNTVNEGQVTRKKGVVSLAKQRVKTARPDRLLSCMRVANILSGGLVLLVGISTFLALPGSDIDNRLGISIIAFFLVVFSVLLLLFELRVGDKANEFIDNNFGFLYTHRGKALLIFFLATLCLSSISTKLSRWELSLVIGVFVLMDALFACFAYYSHPTLYQISYSPSTRAKAKPTTANTSANGAFTFAGAGPLSQTQSNLTDGRTVYQYGVATQNNSFARYGYNESPFAIDEQDLEQAGADTSDDDEYKDYVIHNKPIQSETVFVDDHARSNQTQKEAQPNTNDKNNEDDNLVAKC